MKPSIEKYRDPAGHRQRLRDRFLRSGREALPDYELLELLLTYSLPRINTKPIAKALLHKFGTIVNVFQQPNERLEEIQGIGPNTITFFRVFQDCLTRCMEVQVENQRSISNPEDLLLRPGNLHISGRIEWIKENTRRMPEKWGEKHKDYIVGPGEIVINLTAQSLKDEFLGRVCITGADERCLLNQRIARLTPIQISSKFCLWLFKSPIFRHYVDTLNTGSLIQHMFTTQVKEFIFPLPPQEEQEMIVKQMNALIEKRESVLESVALSTGRLSGLDECILAKAFRGELVPQDPADEPASVLLERIREEKARMAAKQQINLKQGGMKKMGRKRRLGGSPGAVHADRRRPGEEKETSDIKREVE